MQITLDLPDEAYAIADAMAKRDSRTIGSVIADLVLGRSMANGGSLPTQGPQGNEQVGWTMPVSACTRRFTSEEVERWEAEEGLR